MQGASQITAGVREGDVLAGKYRVERVLGVGGMGVVVAAHHLHLDEKVAVKFLLPQLMTNPEAVARFVREARAAAKIKSEYVARVFDVGSLENGAPFMVMEFLEGGDLARWLHQRGPLSADQAVEFVLQSCVAIAEAHCLGIVHRDLKPSNLFCIRRPDGLLAVKLLDFGISKMTGANAGSVGVVTRTTAMVGSPFYMSPEQMQSAKDVSTATDIWSLGVILYELLAGQVPFGGNSITEVAINVATQTPRPLRALRPDVPPGLEAAVFKCLEKDPRGRYRNVAELAVALAEFAPRRARACVERIAATFQTAGVSDSPDLPPSPDSGLPGISSATSDLLPAGTMAPTGHTLARGARGRAGLVVLVLAAVVGGGAGALFLVRPGHKAARGAASGGDSFATTSVAPSAPASISAAPPPAVTLLENIGSAAPEAPAANASAGPSTRPPVRPGSSHSTDAGSAHAPTYNPLDHL